MPCRRNPPPRLCAESGALLAQGVRKGGKALNAMTCSSQRSFRSVSNSSSSSSSEVVFRFELLLLLHVELGLHAWPFASIEQLSIQATSIILRLLFPFLRLGAFPLCWSPVVKNIPSSGCHCYADPHDQRPERSPGSSPAQCHCEQSLPYSISRSVMRQFSHRERPGNCQS